MMKRLGNLVLILLLLVATLAVFASCGSDVSEIAVHEDGMPQLIYVQGQDLDLSNGILSVKGKDGETELALNSEGVTVEGYDKSKLGEQTLTVHYGGKSTEITVTVVERMVAVDYLADYLIGDEFDAAKGRLKITRDDGTNYTVQLNHPNVTITGFDSTASVDGQTVTATYSVEGATYTATFPVSVYQVDEVVFQRPNKVAYNSHDGALDLAGGYLTLKGNGGTLEKDIALREDMVTGFDLSAVNKENTPYTQKLTVTYGSKTFTYDIKLTYTSISYIKDNASKFENFDFSGEETPEIPEDLGELALELMELFLDLSAAEQSNIPTSQGLSIARTAITYGFNVWAENVMEYRDAFAIEYGELIFYCESYEAVRAAMDGLRDPDSEMYRVEPILLALMEKFENAEVIPGLTFADYPVMEQETCQELADIFEYMLSLYDQFARIPENWAEQGVMNFADDVEQACTMLLSSDYYEVTFAQIFYSMSGWREKDDAFDILYTYYYALNDTATMERLAAVRLPSALEEFFTYVSVVIDQSAALSQYMVMDSSELLYNYYMAIKAEEKIRTNNDAMIKDLFETLPVNGMLGMDNSTLLYCHTVLEYVRSMEGGFYFYSGGLLGVEAYHALLDQYMDVVAKLFEDDAYLDSAAYGTDVEKMFAMYLALSPTQQYNFLCTLNVCYASLGFPYIAFDDLSDTENMFTCVFVQLVNEYYREKFTVADAFNEFVIAMEVYAKRFSIEGWLDEFKTGMDSVEAAYNAMSAADKATFDRYFGASFEKYKAIRERFNDPVVETDLGEWKDEFEELKSALLSVEVAYYLVEQGYGTYNMFFSAFERADSIAKNILANAPAEIVDAYYHELLYVMEDDVSDEEGTDMGGETVKIEWTFDFVVNSYRSQYITYQIDFNGNNIYDLYLEYEMAGLMNGCYDILWAFIYSDDDAATPDFNREKVLQALNTFSNLSVDAQTMFLLMEGENGYYYMALETFINQNFTEAAGEVALKLLTLEQNYILYAALQDAESLADLNEVYTELVEMYAALSGEDKASFADLEGIYALNIEKYEAITQ